MKKIILIIAIVGCGLAIYWFFFLRVGVVKVPIQNSQSAVADVEQIVDAGAVIDNNSIFDRAPHEENKEDLEKTAMFFAQKFGSFSNQGNYENINDLMSLMSDSMKALSQEQIKNGQQKEGNGKYYSVESRAINASTLKFDKNVGEAIVAVDVMRQELGGDAVLKKLKIDFKKTNNIWKVNAANWE